MNYAPLCEKQTEYIRRSMTSWLNVAEGGKRAGKNVTNILAWAISLENHPNKLHLAAGVSISAAKLNILDSDGLGLTHIFKGRCREGQYKDRDALYIQTRTGEKIVLISGGADRGSEAKIKGQTFGSVYITEVNECAEVFVKECFARTLSSRDRKIFMDLNPKGPQHWFYIDLLNFYDKSAAEGTITGYNYEHFTVLDNLSMSSDQLRTLLLSYDKKSFWYTVDILGLRTAPEGVIYDMWSNENTFLPETLQEGWKTVCAHYVGVDYGTSNATVFLDAYDDGATYWIDREYYYDGRAERRQKTDEQYADDLDAFLEGRKDAIIIIDPAAASFITALRNRGYMIKPADNAVRDGLRVVSTLMSKRLIRVRADACPNLIREISGYVWDEKARLRGEEAPVKVDDHCLSGDTLVDTLTGQRPIKSLIGKIGLLFCRSQRTGKRRIALYCGAHLARKHAPVYRVVLEDGRTIRATADHKVLTEAGWKQMQDLTREDRVIDIGKQGQGSVRVVSVTFDGYRDVYDLTVPFFHNFSICGGLIVHNCCDALRYIIKTTASRWRVSG